MPKETLEVYGDVDGKWWIGSLGPTDGPYVDKKSAINAAIDRAKVLGEAGHNSTVAAVAEQVWLTSGRPCRKRRS